MTVYKVVRRRSTNRYESATHLGRVLQYRLDHATTPHAKCGPICAFSRIKDAAQFYKEWEPFASPMAILLCIAEPSSGGAIWRSPSLWRLDARGYEEYPIRALPQGTVLCDSITPITEVSPDGQSI